MSISISNRIIRTDRPNLARGHFYTWSVPPQSHRASNCGFITPLSRVLIGAIDSDPTSSLPSGFSTYGNNDPTGWAKRIADWQEYLGYYRGIGFVGDGASHGYLFLQNWGIGSISGGLINNPLDSVVGGLYGSGCFYNASGIAVWRSLTQRFASGLFTELALRTGIYPQGLAAPHLCDADYEADFANVIVPNNSGWLSYATGDSRFTTEVIAEKFIAASGAFVGVTFSNMYSDYLALGSGQPNLNASLYAADNRTFLNWFTKTTMQVKGYALQKALYEPLKSLFPNTRCGNYELTAPVSTGVWYDHFNTFNGITFGTGDRRILRCDFQAPNLYPPQMTAGRFDSSAGYGSTESEIYVNYTKLSMSACVTNNNLSTIPWIPHPDKIVGDGGGVGYIQTSGDIVEILNHGAVLDINEWTWWYDNGQESWDTLYNFSNYGIQIYSISGV